MMPLNPAKQMTKIGQPIKVNRSVLLPLIRCCPQYANVPYTEAIQVGQSTTGLAKSGKRLINHQRSSSPIIPSAVDSHKPKMNIEVKKKVSIIGFGFWYKAKVVKLPECSAWSVLVCCFAKSTAQSQRKCYQSTRNRQCHRCLPQRANYKGCCY